MPNALLVAPKLFGTDGTRESAVQLRDILRATRRRWWLVAGALAVMIALAMIVNATSQPRYATSVTFFVTTPSQATGESYQGGLFSEQRVKSYVSLITSDR